MRFSRPVPPAARRAIAQLAGNPVWFGLAYGVLASVCLLLSPNGVAATVTHDGTARDPAAQGAPAAGRDTPLPPGAVARVNDVAITQAQLDQAVAATRQADTPALRATVKNELIARELFRQAAAKARYDVRPQVVQAAAQAAEQARTSAMVIAYLRDTVKPAPVTDAQVRAKYDEIVAQLGAQECKPSVIVVKDEATATTVLGQLRKGGDFAQLARQYSQGPNATLGGSLGWVAIRTPVEPGRTQGWPQPAAEALVKLPQGAVSSAPISVGDAFWILRVDEKRATQIPSYDATQAALRQQLERASAEKATAQVIVGLMRQSRIQQ